MKTHEVLDLMYHEDENQSYFSGTYQECTDFVEEQAKYGSVYTYKVVPIIKNAKQ